MASPNPPLTRGLTAGLTQSPLYPYGQLLFPNAASPTNRAGQLRTSDAPTSSSSPWSVQHAASAVLKNGELSGQSCPLTTSCAAVGSYYGPTGYYLTLAEQWNGVAWTTQKTPDPSGATDSYLTGVSCPTSGSCTAVGDYYTSSGKEVTLVEVLNGGSWVVEPSPSPSGAAESILYSIACVPSGTCTAVGYSETAGGAVSTLVLTGSGSTWTIDSSPNPGPASNLANVACTASGTCVAVGAYDNADGAATPLVELGSGDTWSVQSTPPTDSTYADLLAVSCISGASCIAVGYEGDPGAASTTLAEAWNGISWSIQTTPDPSGAGDSFLEGLTCTSSDTCTAVGYYEGAFPNPGGAFAEVLSGSTWSVQQTGFPAGGLSAVSCPTGNDCIAVGGEGSSTLGERWNGHKWSTQKTTDPSGVAFFNSLNSIACTAANSCVAVGNTQGGDGILIDAWNGAKWSTESSSAPSGADVSSLQGVACPAVATCVAVGYEHDATDDTDSPLVETSDGTTWSTQAVPSPASGSSELASVSCSSPEACVAVGYDENGNSLTTLTEVWNGVSWSIEVAPSPSGTSATFNSVSCSSSTACTAVGSYDNASEDFVTLAEQWNGTKWVLQTTPNPAGADLAILNGVSCLSASSCMAVGGNGSDPLAEWWNGTKWTIQKVSSSASSSLNGIDCTSSTACTVVGSDVGEWNGATWKFQSNATPPGATEALSSGVSCVTALACTAVGQYENKNGTRVLLSGASGFDLALAEALS
jgi:hypothetical protein